MLNSIVDFFSNIGDYISKVIDVVSQFYDLCISAIEILPNEIKIVLLGFIPVFIIVIVIKIKG